MDNHDLASIKNSIENWKDGNNHAYPQILSYHQIQWLVNKVQDLEYKLEQALSTKVPEAPITDKSDDTVYKQLSELRTKCISQFGTDPEYYSLGSRKFTEFHTSMHALRLHTEGRFNYEFCGVFVHLDPEAPADYVGFVTPNKSGAW